MTLSAPTPAEDVGFNMTPMIDIVFQLIIFFMLATDMSQATLEAVVLPEARASSPDKPPPGRLIINVSHMNEGEAADCAEYRRGPEGLCMDERHWVVKVLRQRFTLSRLEGELQIQAAMFPDPEHPGMSARPILIRADGRAPYAVVQGVMAACSKYGVWKLEIGTHLPEGVR